MARHCLLAHTRGITLDALPVKTPRQIYGWVGGVGRDSGGLLINSCADVKGVLIPTTRLCCCLSFQIPATQLSLSVFVFIEGLKLFVASDVSHAR